MLIIRDYGEEDREQVGILIADTYSQFNLTFTSPEEQKAFLGPFQHTRSLEPSKQEAIARVIWSKLVLVAEKDGEIVGVLRGKMDQLQSLFVRGDCHRQGIGRKLVEGFEQYCRKEGADIIRLKATLYAVPFYQAVGYRKSTGTRRMRSFEGEGLKYQPMKKKLK